MLAYSLDLWKFFIKIVHDIQIRNLVVYMRVFRQNTSKMCQKLQNETEMKDVEIMVDTDMEFPKIGRSIFLCLSWNEREMVTILALSMVLPEQILDQVHLNEVET